MLFLLLFSFYSNAGTESWRCTEESTTREGKVWMACGVGDDSSSEGNARLSSMKNALAEFTLMCNMSSDCKGRDKSVEPMRSSCVAFVNNGVTTGFRCYRLIKITVD